MLCYPAPCKFGVLVTLLVYRISPLVVLRALRFGMLTNPKLDRTAVPSLWQSAVSKKTHMTDKQTNKSTNEQKESSSLMSWRGEKMLSKSVFPVCSHTRHQLWDIFLLTHWHLNSQWTVVTTSSLIESIFSNSPSLFLSFCLSLPALIVLKVVSTFQFLQWFYSSHISI